MIDYKVEKAIEELFKKNDFGKVEIIVIADNHGNVKVLELDEIKKWGKGD